MRNTILTVAAYLVPLFGLPAQQATTLHPGQRVRVTSTSSKDVTGVVSQARADSIVVFTEPTGATLAFATPDLRKVDVSRGRSAAEGAKRGAMWGGGIGAGFAVLVAAIAASDKNTYQNDVYSVGDFAANMVGGGLVWGAVIGAFVKAERWDHVAFQPRTGLSSVGVRLSLR
jgi:hypothetical protein